MKIRIFAKSPDKKGFVRLYLYVSINNKHGRFPTKVKVLEDSWNEKEQVINRQQEEYKHLNSLLTKRIGQLNSVFQALEYENVPVTVQEVSRRYNALLLKKTAKNNLPALSLLEYFDLYVDDRDKIRSVKGYLRKFKVVKYWLKQFKPDVDWTDITAKFYNDWITYMYDEGELESNTVSGYVKKLKSVMNAAVLDPRTRHLSIPPDFQLFRDTYIKPKPFYLSWEDVGRIERFEPLPEHLIYKQEFLFRCYTGIRHSDLFNAKPENFIKNRGRVYLDFMSIKTKVDQNLILHDKAVEILKAWNFKPPRLYQSDCNEIIKKICRGANLKSKVQKVRYSGNERKVTTHEKWELVTTHTARRTFGRRWMENGGTLQKLRVYFGQATEKQTQEYIGWSTEEVNEEMLRVI